MTVRWCEKYLPKTLWRAIQKACPTCTLWVRVNNEPNWLLSSPNYYRHTDAEGVGIYWNYEFRFWRRLKLYPLVIAKVA